MNIEPHDPLRVLIANERRERLQTTTGLVAAMGHHVIARSLEVSEVAAATAEAMPDVALVGLGESSEHALDLISQIVQEAACPVIAILESNDADFVNEAAKRGIFAYVTDGDPEELQSAVDIVLRRFAEFHRLEGALGRRALTERAKGIMMERYSIDEREAFELLRAPFAADGPQADRRGRGGDHQSSPAREPADRVRQELAGQRRARGGHAALRGGRLTR